MSLSSSLVPVSSSSSLSSLSSLISASWPANSGLTTSSSSRSSSVRLRLLRVVWATDGLPILNMTVEWRKKIEIKVDFKESGTSLRLTESHFGKDEGSNIDVSGWPSSGTS
ncbi:hypothetical protein KC367_g85 [Hortaea werneckii]|nr:hypothetical protein KC367_g85 [Hortaea werneckii]